MIPGGLRFRIRAAAGILSLLILGAAFLLARQAYHRVLERRFVGDLHIQAELIRESLIQRWSVLDDQELADLVRPVRELGTAIVVIAIDGRVLYSTLGESAFVKNLYFQPEVQEALKIGRSTRRSRLASADPEYQCLAIRAGSDDSIRGALWLARPLEHAYGGNALIRYLSVWFLLLAVLAAGLLAVAAESFRTRMCRRLIAGARELSEDQSIAEDQLLPLESEEYAMLAAALRRVREKLDEQVFTIDRQRMTLETLIDQLHEGVIVTDANGRIALINPAAVGLLHLSGCTADDTRLRLIGKSVERCIPQHEILELLIGGVEGAAGRRGSGILGDAALSRDNEETEKRIQLDSPRGTIYLLAQAAPIVLPDDGIQRQGGKPGRMLVLTDITELASIIRVKTDFIANASHELRTPLAAVRTAIETIAQMDLAREEPAARRFIDTIHRQCARLEALVTDLLDLSRLESPTARFEPTALNLRFEVEDLYQRFESRITEKAIRWRVEVRDDVPVTLTANQHLLHLVLDNLLDNAIKFSEPNGAITLACVPVAGGVAISVADTGCGIPPEDSQRVFERFYQVERARSGADRGTGLGLSIVRHAVAAMNGTVRLDSKPGSGTRVTFEIPQPDLQRTGAQHPRKPAIGERKTSVTHFNFSGNASITPELLQ